MRTELLACMTLLVGVAAGCARASCARAPLAVQVLGSGGPIPDDARASSAYLIWHEGRARVMIDAGGGSFVRFGEAGARIEDLDLVGLSHLHVDHTGDLPALLEGGFFSERARPLIVTGPEGGGKFPGIEQWLELELGPAGAYRYADWLLEPGARAWHLDVRELDRGPGASSQLQLDGIELRAMGVEHGPVPALAYRVEIAGRAIVFGGDQNGDVEAFVDFARGADLLIMHHAVGEEPDAVAAKLHAKPSEIAAIAHAAQAETLVLSHHMARSLRELSRSRETITTLYDGQLEVAEDLACYPLQ
jgi:ribonuclease BN (tRNA processing enzyme)